MEVQKVRERLKERGLALVLTDDSKDLIVNKACKDLDFGARPLRRAIENLVEDPLSEELLKGEFSGMDTITVEVVEVAGKKQLKFHGSVQHAAEQPAAVAAGSAAAPDGLRRLCRVTKTTSHAAGGLTGRESFAAGQPARFACWGLMLLAASDEIK